MSGDLPERDPLADLVARSLGTRVTAVDAESLATDDGIERKRLRYDVDGGTRTVLFERSARGRTLEAQLLPFLARKSPHVPVVHARGLPPLRAPLGPWLLLEDVLAAPPACDGNVADVVRAKLAIERAVAGDVPALRALGVVDDPRPLPPELAAVPRALVHGAFDCAIAHRVDRGVVITGWSQASLGCAVLDIASLAQGLVRAGRADDARRVRDAYLRESGIADAGALLASAERLISW